ncbi:MAG: hypothetical protein IPL53_13055 [Ignavibacteria bacterium]|nr:hypothetical protein [Ignavibacteria bacterium]
MKTDILSGRYFNYFCYLLIVLIPIYLLYNYFSYAFTVNSYNGFPLDDPWIHLTFGKNLKEYFSFSYYKNENATAGSTSPLYTFIVAAGFFFTDNEMILSYVLGGLFFVFACIYFFKLTRIDLGDKLILCLLCTLIFILDYNMNFTALSGMETSLFIFELLLGAYFYKAGKAIPLGITLGLIMWTRPDGVAFIAAVIIDYLYNRYFVKSDERLKHFTAKQTVYILLISGGITSAYFIMNYVLSGTFFPNTYSAKIAYFADSGKRLYFLKDFVWELYTVKHYSILMFGFVFSLLKFLYDLIKRKSNPNSLYILFIFAFLIMYVIKLPTVNKYGRYQIPLVPFFILVSLIGFKDFFSLILFFLKNFLAANLLTGISFVILIFISIDSYETYKIKFATQCKYTHNRQMAVANWINKNTNENHIIATHDVGAIGFYTNRRIVDVAGLVTPELTKSINEDNYFEIVSDYLKKTESHTLHFSGNGFILKIRIPFTELPQMSRITFLRYINLIR